MSITDFAREPLPLRLVRKVRTLLGPAALFLRGFAKNPVMVGAIVPSSRRTIARVLRPVDWDKARVFVEYGPGVGTFCRPVLERLRRDGMLIAIDPNPDFIAHLQATIPDPRFRAVLGSAADVAEILAAQGLAEADYILSGLPFSTLPPGVATAIMAATSRVLRPGGAFLVYQYTAYARRMMRHHFPCVDKGFEAWNVPPCVIGWGWKA